MRSSQSCWNLSLVLEISWFYSVMRLSLSCRRLIVKDCSRISRFCCQMSQCQLHVVGVTLRCFNSSCLFPWAWTLLYIVQKMKYRRLCQQLLLYYNDMLLEWLSGLAGKKEEEEKNERQVLRDIGSVLVKIDALHFQGLAEGELMKQEDMFGNVYAMMSRFLTLREFKRFNSQYEKQILKERQVEELVALLLYLAVNSELKREAVESILDFGEHQQRQLMRIIQRVESNCEQIVEFKKIVEKIESIEQDNEALKARIAAAEVEFQQRLALVQEIEGCNATVADRIAEYQEEKEMMFKDMHVNRMEEFVEICQLNRQQNAEITRSLENLEEERTELRQQNGHLRKEMKSHGETIQKQIKEIDELKAKCRGMEQQTWQEQQQTAIPDIPMLPLKDNKNILNIDRPSEPQKPKLPTDRTQCSVRQDPLEESFQVKNNLNVLLSLNQLEKLQVERLMELQKLKGMRQLKLQRQKQLTRKLVKIMSCHRSFSEQCSQLINP